MSGLVLPLKIRWMIDLRVPLDERWSPSVVKKLHKVRYDTEVTWQLLPSSRILSDFAPVYKTHVMQKSDYHLDPLQALKTVDDMSRDASYKLLWFTSPDGSLVYGGTILHILPHKIKIAYRAFDHELARKRGLRMLDYYADKILQEYSQSLGVSLLSRGLMKHPCDSLGLSLYKLSVGCRPLLDKKAETKLFTEEELSLAATSSLFAYYTDPDAEGYFRQAVVRCREDLETVRGFIKLAERINVKVHILYD